MSVTKETEHMVTFIQFREDGKDITWTQRKSSEDYKWFHNLSDAREYAIKFILQKIAHHENMIADFNRCHFEIATSNFENPHEEDTSASKLLS